MTFMIIVAYKDNSSKIMTEADNAYTRFILDGSVWEIDIKREEEEECFITFFTSWTCMEFLVLLYGCNKKVYPPGENKWQQIC